MEWLQTHCLKTKRIFVGIGNKPIRIWRQKMGLSSIQSRRWIMLKCKCRILGDRLQRRNSRKLWLLSHQRLARQMCRNSIVYLLAELKNRLKISIFLWRKKLCISLIFSNFVVSNYKVIYFTLCTTCMQIS